jgi:hypothetical protein
MAYALAFGFFALTCVTQRSILSQSPLGTLAYGIAL